MRDRAHAKQRIVLQIALHAGELAERPLVGGPAVGQQFAFQHDLRIRGHHHVHGLGAYEMRGLAAQASRNLHFVQPGRGFIGGRHVLERMHADRDRHGERLFALVGPGVVTAQVGGREEINGHFPPRAKHQPVASGIRSELGIIGEGNAAGNVGCAVLFMHERDRQRREVDVVARRHNFLAWRIVHEHRR